MGLFRLSKKDRMIKDLIKENKRLHRLCAEKDSYFLEMISDGMRHGSPLAARHMADRKKYIHGK